MSHCTRFAFSYRDEMIAVKAFRKLGLRPETSVVSWYSSDAMKKIAGPLGIPGQNASRAICAMRAPYQYMLVHQGDVLHLVVESHDALALADVKRVAQIEADFRLSYLKVMIEEELGRTFDDAGVPWRMDETSNALKVSFGPAFSRHISFRITDSKIEEEVSGVVGASCERLTATLEGMLLAPDAELLTEWKPAYHETIQDEVVQVLRLGL